MALLNSLLDLKAFLKCGALLDMGNQKVLVGFGNREWLKKPMGHNLPHFYFPDFLLKAANPWFTHQSFLVVTKESLLNLLQQEIALNLETAVRDAKLAQDLELESLFRGAGHSQVVKDRLTANDSGSRDCVKLASPTAVSRLNLETLITWDFISEHQFKQSFCETKMQIEKGCLKKAVPYAMQMANHKVTKFQLQKSLISCLKFTLQNRSFIYGFWDNNGLNSHGMLGATPEILFKQRQQGDISTMACAGTKASDVPSLSFLLDRKERKEHAIVIKDIATVLKHFGLVSYGRKKVVTFRKLKHLITKILLKPAIDKKLPSFIDLIEALHPTPALGVFPRRHGVKYFTRLESRLKRDRFGAPVGYYIPNTPHSSSCCYVAIRNMQWTSNQIKLFAGCGVMALSHYKREWDEILLKFSAIKEILAL